LQVPVAVLQVRLPQAWLLGEAQVPAPLQTGAADDMLPAVHAAALVPQLVPCLARRQPPLPSQVPSWPHSPPEVLHIPREAPPAEMGLQRPSS